MANRSDVSSPHSFADIFFYQLGHKRTAFSTIHADEKLDLHAPTEISVRWAKKEARSAHKGPLEGNFGAESDDMPTTASQSHWSMSAWNGESWPPG